MKGSFMTTSLFPPAPWPAGGPMGGYEGTGAGACILFAAGGGMAGLGPGLAFGTDFIS